MTRSVSPSLFANAPRLHQGLRNNEFPAILERGEEVIPKNGARDNASRTPTVQIYNNTSKQFADEQVHVDYDPRRQVVGIILEDKRNNGPIRRNTRR